jgi:7,8-dihydropterin-6-yl-methyl-4-(beta-D-ribofuranosyl)aminobenzene 5'-phosphate synthase
MKLKIIYDNTAKKGYKADWGFACFIEPYGILFDTGADASVLVHNMERMGIKPEEIKELVISHDHWDHTGGMEEVLKLNPDIKMYKPDAFSKPAKIGKDIYTTGAMGFMPKEQSLILDTKKGLVIITGCAHPGIVKIIERAKEFLGKRIYLVLGGFHLGGMSKAKVGRLIDRFKQLGVENVAPSHCTGEAAIGAFEERYKKGFVVGGAGSIIEV